jgi:hypothetical protein
MCMCSVSVLSSSLPSSIKAQCKGPCITSWVAVAFCSRLLWTSPSLNAVLGRDAGSGGGSSGGSGGGAAAAAVLAGMQELAALDSREGAHFSRLADISSDGISRARSMWQQLQSEVAACVGRAMPAASS